MLISESLADSPDSPLADPIGQRRPSALPGPFTIVGVVGDVKQMSLTDQQIGRGVHQRPQSGSRIARCRWWSGVRGDAGRARPAVRQAVWSVDKDQPVVRVATMDDPSAASAANDAFALILFEAFALAHWRWPRPDLRRALWQRRRTHTRDRRAVGARRVAREHSWSGRTPGDDARHAQRQSSVSGAIATSEAIVTLLFGVSNSDPVAYVAVIALLLSVVCGSMLDSRVACRARSRSGGHIEGGIGDDHAGAR